MLICSGVTKTCPQLISYRDRYIFHNASVHELCVKIKTVPWLVGFEDGSSNYAASFRLRVIGVRMDF